MLLSNQQQPKKSCIPRLIIKDQYSCGSTSGGGDLHTRETNDDGDSIQVCMRGSLTTSVQTTVVVSLIVLRLHLLRVVSQHCLVSW
jgi:hypothetical protein